MSSKTEIEERINVKVLHITAHLGGGVGRALSSIVIHEKKNNEDVQHKIILLENPEKMQFYDDCLRAGIDVLTGVCDKGMYSEVKSSDIVVLHWWNHPIMAKFMASFPDTPTRLVIWAHVNGCNYPVIPFRFVELPHRTFFTTPFSYENPLWNEHQREIIKKNSTVVYGLGKLEFYPPVRKKRSGEFVIGYVGTLSSSKLHPQYVEYCNAVLRKVPTAKFVMVGDIAHGNDIMQKARAYHIDCCFRLVGYSDHISRELEKFDVFAYPLNPEHFGTTENALLEAMAFGLPVVALNHNTEKYIIQDQRKVGFLADSINHYADSIRYLFDNPEEAARIGDNAREYVRRKYTFENNICLMRGEFESVCRSAKRRFNFRSIFGTNPHEWFLSCLGLDCSPFTESMNRKLSSARREVLEIKIRECTPILREKTKSSIEHFSNTFPDDEYLMYWLGLIENGFKI